MSKLSVFTLLLSLALSTYRVAGQTCTENGISITVLGAGGPELDDGYASTGYLLWVKGKARVIIDAGTGSSLGFSESGAAFSDIKAILLTHLHVDHAGDLPGYIKGSYFTPRSQSLSVIGPAGNRLMPATSDYVARLIGREGAFAYLQDYLEPDLEGDYKIDVKDVPLKPKSISHFDLGDGLSAQAIPVHHGPVAAVAWRINHAECGIVFSGDMRHAHGAFASFAHNADLLIMHNAVPENAGAIALNLHMPPSVIGELAGESHAKAVLLSHFMRRTQSRREETSRQIRQHFHGPLVFADQGHTYPVQ